MASQIISLPIQTANQTRNDAVSKRVVHNTRPENETQTNNAAKPANEEIKDLSAPTPPGDPKKPNDVQESKAPLLDSLRKTIGTEENPLNVKQFIQILIENPGHKDFSKIIFEDGFNFKKFLKEKGDASVFRSLWMKNVKGINFSNSRLRKVNFSDLGLHGFNFKGANLIGSDFTGSSIMSSNFDQADLSNSNFNRANISRSCVGIDFYPETSFNQTRLSGSSFVGSEVKCAFENSELDQCHFRWTNFNHASFKDCSFKESTFINVKTPEASFDGVDMSGTYIRNTPAYSNPGSSYTPDASIGFRRVEKFNIKSLEGARVFNPGFPESLKSNDYITPLESNDYSGANLQNLIVRIKNLSDINFKGANLSGLILDRCKVNNCDFEGANLSEADTIVRFENCNFSKADFTNAKRNTTRQSEFINADFSAASSVPRLLVLGSENPKGLPGTYENMDDESSQALNREINCGRIQTGIKFKNQEDEAISKRTQTFLLNSPEQHCF